MTDVGRADDEEFRRALGARIQEARILAGYEKAAPFYRALVAQHGEIPGLMGYDAYAKTERGEKLLKDPRAIAAIAATAGVSAAWLIQGETAAPEGFREWLAQSGESQIADDPRARIFLASQPVPPGYHPDLAFWDYALVAYRRGLRGPEAAAALADTTKRRG